MILISELCITPDPVPQDVADKLVEFHILPMMKVRADLNMPIWASLKSGYRPEAYELKQGRKGTSEHTFKTRGAVDWTTRDFKNTKERFKDSIIRNTKYTRICIYGGFIHCDYKPTLSGKRELYKSDGKYWSLIKFV